jgi:N-carbamoyl-L-amino-acid hydrolase
VATVGDVAVRPGIPTAIPSQAELVVDQRHHEPEILDAMAVEAERSSRAICDEEGTRVSWSQIQRVDPVAFDAALVETAEACVREVTGACLRVRSGALHDAVMVARAGVPTVMLFVQSIGGLSHTRLEDSHSEHLEQAVAALGRLTTSILAPTPPV